MGVFDTFTNMLFGTERVKASKAECKEKKKVAEEKYNEEVKRIDAECEASLIKAKEADKAPEPVAPVVTTPTDLSQAGGKKARKSKKRSKSNRKKTSRK